MGRPKLEHIYDQPFQKRLGRISVVYFFHKTLLFSMLSSTFRRPVFTPVDLSTSQKLNASREL